MPSKVSARSVGSRLNLKANDLKFRNRLGCRSEFHNHIEGVKKHKLFARRFTRLDRIYNHTNWYAVVIIDLYLTCVTVSHHHSSWQLIQEKLIAHTLLYGILKLLVLCAVQSPLARLAPIGAAIDFVFEV